MVYLCDFIIIIITIVIISNIFIPGYNDHVFLKLSLYFDNPHILVTETPNKF